MKRAVVTVGLGFGDEGKGSIVDYLCRKLNADLVIRYCGGSQCGHNVVLNNGWFHTFSQFGSGTLARVPTYIGPQVIIYPEAMENEASHLVSLGVDQPFKMLKVHPRCLVTTKYHRAANRLREISRGGLRHGSCGHGIGEARRYWLNYGKDSIFAKDLKNIHVLRDKLELMRQRFLMDLQPIFESTTSAEEDVFDLLISEVAGNLRQASEFLNIESCPAYETAIFEGAQGVLLDEYNGFHPNTTWSTVTMRNAEEMIAESKPKSVIKMGVMRPYLTRHGAGPLPTEDNELTEIVKDKGNPWNAWQMSFRTGWFDVSLFDYALKVTGKLDCIAVNCVDHLMRICPKIAAYRTDYPLSKYRLNASEGITNALTSVPPMLVPAKVEDILKGIELKAPIAIKGLGPAYKDKERMASAKWLS